MGFYNDLLNKVELLIKDETFDEANKLINDELSMPYIPSDVEAKLIELLKTIPCDTKTSTLNDDEIVKYLNGNENSQLRAVDELNRRNLRDYIDICNTYLISNGFINAKVLLIDSLIKQDIGDDMKMVNEGVEYNFIPKYVMSPESSLGFLKANSLLEKYFMKEPSKYELAKGLLYKECLLALPINYEEDEANMLSNKIISFIEDAFK